MSSQEGGVNPSDSVEEWDPDALPEEKARVLRQFERMERALVETLPANAFREPALVAFQMAMMQTRLAYNTAQLAERKSHE